MSELHDHPAPGGPTPNAPKGGPATDELRERAVGRLRKRSDFRTHVLVYLLVNAFLVMIWALTSSGGVFWPVFPLVGWGIGVAINAWDVYRRDPVTEDRVRREMDRLAAEARPRRGGEA